MRRGQDHRDAGITEGIIRFVLLLMPLLLMPIGRLSKPVGATNNSRLLPGGARQEGHSPSLFSVFAFFPACCTSRLSLFSLSQ